MKRVLKMSFALVFAVCMIALGFPGHNLQAATPRVMVTDYKVSGNQVVAGKDFQLTVTLSNNASKAVKNLKLTVSTENGELLPAKGAGTAYIDVIEAGETTDIEFPMTAAYGLEEKSYKVNIKTEYTASSGSEYTVDDSIFLPVSLEQRASITDIFFAQNIVELGDTVEVTAVVNNLGEGKLYNVTAMISGDNVDLANNYIGNIESGKSGNIELISKAKAVSMGDKIENKLIVTYEDKTGKEYSTEVEIGKQDLTISEPSYGDLEKVKEDTGSSEVIKTVIGTIVAIGLIVGVIVLCVKRRKKKIQMLEDF